MLTPWCTAPEDYTESVVPPMCHLYPHMAWLRVNHMYTTSPVCQDPPPVTLARHMRAVLPCPGTPLSRVGQHISCHILSVFSMSFGGSQGYLARFLPIGRVVSRPPYAHLVSLVNLLDRGRSVWYACAHVLFCRSPRREFRPCYRPYLAPTCATSSPVLKYIQVTR